jgi:MinD-like ATPase involved in chromosome partitioning or flagellar assembly
MSFVLALASGKGGTGKTVLSLAIAQLLTANDKRVAIYDADASTRGLTHYVSAHVDTSKPGLAEARSPEAVQTVRLESSPGEIVVYPMAGILDSDAGDLNVETALANLLARLKADRAHFDYQIVDLQAGISPIIDRVYPVADATLVVTEADPVSIAAVAYLRRHLDRLGRRPVFGLVNRALPGEEPYFESLTDYAKNILWTSVIPLDPDVRRSFFRRELPLRPASGDPFALSLTDVLRRIGPPLSGDLQRTERWVQAPGSDAFSDYEALLSYRSQLERDLSRGRLRAEQTRFTTSLAASVAGLSVGVLALLAVQGTIPDILAIVGGALGFFGAATLSFYGRFRVAASNELEIESTRRELARVEEQLRSFEVRYGRLASSSLPKGRFGDERGLTG